MKIDKNIELHGNYLRLVFMCKKVKCAECLYLKNDKKGLKEAQDKRDDILSEIRRGTFKYENYFPNSKKIELFDAKPNSYLLSTLLNEQKDKIENNCNFALSTKRDYKRFIDKIFIPNFGHYEVTKFDKKHIISWIEQSKLTAKSLRTAIIPLRDTLVDAMHKGIIEVTPFNQMDMRRLLSTKRKETKYKVVPFTEKEKTKIFEAASGEFINLLQFGFYTGLRTGEILALRWEDVDLDNRKINVVHTMMNGTLQRTKTKDSTRTVKLLDKAFYALSDQKNYRQNDDGFVFHNPNTGRYWPKTDSIRKQWISLLKKLGIEYRNAYQTRHSFASMLITNDENIHKISKYLGHKDTTMLTTTYGKYIDEDDNHGFKNNY